MFNSFLFWFVNTSRVVDTSTYEEGTIISCGFFCDVFLFFFLTYNPLYYIFSPFKNKFLSSHLNRDTTRPQWSAGNRNIADAHPLRGSGHRAAGRGPASGRNFTDLSSQQTIPAEKPPSTPILKSSTCYAKFGLDTQRRASLYSRPSEASSYHLTAGDRRPHLSPQRHDRREPKEEIARLNALGERLANGLREAYDTDALKEVRPVVERGD
jgi:hypothetical protein